MLLVILVITQLIVQLFKLVRNKIEPKGADTESCFREFVLKKTEASVVIYVCCLSRSTVLLQLGMWEIQGGNLSFLRIPLIFLTR